MVGLRFGHLASADVILRCGNAVVAELGVGSTSGMGYTGTLPPSVGGLPASVPNCIAEGFRKRSISKLVGDVLEYGREQSSLEEFERAGVILKPDILGTVPHEVQLA
jgi:hypothetical protein